MKTYLSVMLVFVLTAAMFTGCGCTSQDAMYTTAPTSMPTIMTTPTTETTRATTAPTTEATIDRGNGPLEDTTMGTTGSTEATADAAEGLTRRVPAGQK